MFKKKEKEPFLSFFLYASVASNLLLMIVIMMTAFVVLYNHKINFIEQVHQDIKVQSKDLSVFFSDTQDYSIFKKLIGKKTKDGQDQYLYFDVKEFIIQQSILLKVFLLCILVFMIMNLRLLSGYRKLILQIKHKLENDASIEHLEHGPNEAGLISFDLMASIERFKVQYEEEVMLLKNKIIQFEDLANQLKFFEYVFEHAQFGFLWTDRHGTVIRSNKAHFNFFREEMKNFQDYSIITQNSHLDWNNHPLHLQRVPFYCPLFKKRYFYIASITYLDNILYIFVEETEQLLFEMRKIIYDRLNSLRSLASGLGHEINNPLAVILNSMQNITRATDFKREAVQKKLVHFNLNQESLTNYFKEMKLDVIIQGAQDASLRIAKIVWRILTLTKKNHMDFVSINPVELIENALLISFSDYNAREIKQHLTVKKEFINQDLSVKCRAFELEIALVEILKNSLWSLGRSNKSQKQLNIKIQQYHQYAQITIEDNGIGLNPLFEKRVFEPFFTLKPTGQGVGLGLFIAYFVIENQHHGEITFESREGEHAKVTVQLIHE